MSLFSFMAIILPVLSIGHAIFSIIAKIILRMNGYKINYFVTKFFYETKILKILCRENEYLYSVLVAYYIVTILLFLDFVLFILLFFIIGLPPKW